MDAHNNQNSNGRKRTILLFGGGILAIVALAGIAGARLLSQTDEDATQAVYEVTEGPLTISVTESGTVQPRDQVIIKSDVEGTATILSLVDEGTHVKKGDLLVQLDASTLQDSKVDQEIKVQNTEATFISARENLQVVENQSKSDNEEADLTLRFAKEDLKNYKEGEYPNEEKELQGSIALAEEELQRAEEELHWSQILYKEKYLSESEMKADELAVSKAKLDLELAQNQLTLLQNFTYKRQIDQLESDIRQAEMAQERTKLEGSANMIQAEASMKAAEAEFTREKSRLEKIEAQIAKATIYAPTDGLVVYATSAQVSHPGRDVEPLDEGQTVRERQELIYLPTGSAFKAEISIHESSLEKIKVGLPVRLTVDALPGYVFDGTVASIAPLPDAQSMFMNPDLKVYTTVVYIDNGSDVLRSGMTCKAEIIVEQHKSVTYVPVQSVVRLQGQPTVFVLTETGNEPRPVEIGLDNNKMVRIISGATSGEKVLLNPPLESTAISVDTLQESAGTSKVENTGQGASGAGTSPQEADGTGTAPAEGSAPSGFGPDDSGNRGGPAGMPEMTDEQRQKMRERMESMTPEEREKMRQQRPPMRAGAGEEK